MLHKGDKARLTKSMRYILDIEKIVARHTNAKAALDDLEGQHALLMCLLQVGEILNHIRDDELAKTLQVRKIAAFRNVIAHEYEAVMPDKTCAVIENNIPELKTQILAILEQEDDFPQLQKMWEG